MEKDRQGVLAAAAADLQAFSELEWWRYLKTWKQSQTIDEYIHHQVYYIMFSGKLIFIISLSLSPPCYIPVSAIFLA